VNALTTALWRMNSERRNLRDALRSLASGMCRSYCSRARRKTSSRAEEMPNIALPISGQCKTNDIELLLTFGVLGAEEVILLMVETRT
jgi:hypothetical protein